MIMSVKMVRSKLMDVFEEECQSVIKEQQMVYDRNVSITYMPVKEGNTVLYTALIISREQ